MLQEIETNTNVSLEKITLTTEAANAIKDVFTQRNLTGYALRVYVAGNSCCGPQFGMALDNEIRANDKSFETEGVHVIVDDSSINYLRGAKIDYINDPQRGNGFVVDSPADLGSSCGCNSDSSSSGGCGGGSCGCGN